MTQVFRGNNFVFTNNSGDDEIELSAGTGETLNVNGTVTGDILLENGTAAAPSLAFVNDLDTGIYRNTSAVGNLFNVACDGTDVLTVRKKFNTTARLTISDNPVDSITGGSKGACIKIVPDADLNVPGEEAIKIQISDTKVLKILTTESYPSGNIGGFITASGADQSFDINMSGSSVSGIKADGLNKIDIYTNGTNRVVIDGNDTTINNSLTSNNGFCRTTNPAGGTIINVNRNVFTTATMFPAAVTGGNSPPTYTTGSGRMLINKAGKYLVQANYGFVLNASGGRAFNLWKVSPSATLAYISLTANVDDRTVVNMSATLDLIVGDELYLTLYHNSATFTITSDNAVPANFSALRIG